MRRNEQADRINDRIRYEHILLAATDILRMCQGCRRADLDTDMVLRRALTNAVQEIGEAAARISDAGRQVVPELPWGQIVQTRHILVHNYYGVDLDILWKITHEQIPSLPALARRAVLALPLPPDINPI